MPGARTSFGGRAHRDRSFRSAAHPLARVAVAALLLAGAVARVDAAPPQVNHLFPSGARIGTTVTVKVVGSVDPWPPLAWTSTSALEVTASENKLELSVRVDPAANPGVHWIRLYNSEGASEPRPFVVGTLPELVETESNDRPEKSCAVELPAIVNGRLDRAADLDSFAIELTEGATLVADVESARRLDTPMDPVLQIASADGFVLAQNDDDQGRDPRIVFTAPRTASYLVRVFAFPVPPNSSIRFANDPKYVYRLTLTCGAFADHAFPLVVSRLATPVELRGWNIPPELARVVVAPSSDSIVPLRHGSLANTPELTVVETRVETEKLLEVASRQELIVPSTLSGHISRPLEADTFDLRLKNGERVEIEVLARRLGSLLDPIVRITDHDGKELARADDSVGVDPRIVFSAPRDGAFVVEVSDLFGHGGERHVYALSVVTPMPDFTLGIAASAFVVKAGTPLKLPVTITRTHGYKGTIAVSALGLPPGVVCAPVYSTPKGDAAKKVELELTAADPKSAAPFSGAFRIVGREVGPSGRERAATYRRGERNRPLSSVWLTITAPPPPKEAAADDAPSK